MNHELIRIVLDSDGTLVQLLTFYCEYAWNSHPNMDSSFQLRCKLLTFIVRTHRSTRTVCFARDVETSEAFHQNLGARLCVAVVGALGIYWIQATNQRSTSRVKDGVIIPLLSGVRYDK